MKRRDFIKTGMLAAGAAISAPALGSTACSELDVNYFSKPLQWMNYDLLAESLAKAGADGIDLTVRPKGHVLPENAERDLPKAVKAAEKQGLKVKMIVTNVMSGNDPVQERVLKTAAGNGVGIYRMGYFFYDFKKNMKTNLNEFSRTMEGIARLNESVGITGCYQNHHAWQPGIFGGVIWDLYKVLKNIDPKWMGCQYDVRHAIAESTGSWQLGTRLIAPWIQSICLKDFDLKNKRNGMPYPRNLPAGEGVVPWNVYFKLLKELKVNVPATVHIEWALLSKKEKKLPEAEKAKLTVERSKKECAFYREAYQKA
ncbi:MAG: TIM barrel protein [Kiritimatiellia bacterium]